MERVSWNSQEPLRFVDLFCGLGGFRIAVEQECHRRHISTACVFSSDIDSDAQFAYRTNFGDLPLGDITKIDALDIADHDVLFAGFPCQAFSIIGRSRGFEDTRGTLFFDVARILSTKVPKAFVLENVRGLVSHDRGRTLDVIMSTLRQLGYRSEFRILNALDFGLPQKRERVVIVGIREDLQESFSWPTGATTRAATLEEILEDDAAVSDFYFASDQIRESRARAVRDKSIPSGRSIWHENKSGNVSPLAHSCALRAGASYNYLLVDGIRRLTSREMLRLQGFPETYEIPVGYSAMRKLAGNSVPVPMIGAVVGALLDGVFLNAEQSTSAFGSFQEVLA